MAALPVIPNCIRGVFKGRTGPGTPWVNVMHFADAGPDPFATKVAAIEVEMDKFWSSAGFGGGVTGWAAHAGSGARYDSATYTALDGVTASIVNTKSVAGTGAGDNLPPDTAVCITWRTDKRGPRYRGRSYLAGFVESASDSLGQLVAGFVTSLDALGEKLIDELVLNGQNLVVASYKFASYEAVTSCTVNNVFDRQIRRRS